MADPDDLQESLVTLIPLVLGALDRLETITRHMHPPQLGAPVPKNIPKLAVLESL